MLIFAFYKGGVKIIFAHAAVIHIYLKPFVITNFFKNKPDKNNTTCE